MQTDEERRAFAQTTFHPYATAVRLDDFIRDCQADAGTLVFVVGVKAPEKLKDRFVKLGLDSDAVVFDRNEDIRIELIIESIIRRVGAGFCRCLDFD